MGNSSHSATAPNPSQPGSCILFIASVDWSFTSHRLPLALAALDAGWLVHVAASPSSEKSRRSMEQAGIVFHALPLVRGRTNVVSELRAAAAIWSLYRRIKPKLVHLITAKPVIYGGVAARLLRVPAVVSAIPGLGFAFVQRSAWASVRRWMLLAAYWLSLRQSNGRVIFQNSEDFEALVGRGVVRRRDCVLIRGAGVDMSAFHPVPVPEGPITVTFASRMLKEKGVGEFVDAARQLKKRQINARFLLAGDPDPGNPGSVSRSMLEDWHASGDVEWLGFQSNMWEIFTRSHIMCLPSYYGEGVPKVLIEAAACGLPLVTTDMPGCRDIGRQNVNALVVPPRDAVALTAALERLITDPELRSKFGAASRELAVNEFSLKSTVEQTMSLYSALLNP